MAAEIHRLTESGPAVGPEKSVIDFLSGLLAAAERGEIKGIAVAYVSGADGVVTDWAGGCADRHFMLAAASRLEHRINKAILDDDG